MIQLTNLNYQIKKHNILKNINLAIQKGEKVGIIGESGAGKTTLAQLLLSVIKPTSGSRIINAKTILPIFQHPLESFNHAYTIQQSLDEAIRYFSIENHTIIRQRMKQLLSATDLSAQLLNRYPDEVSGGQLQRFNIIRSLMLEPEILICDEITSNLDVIVEQKISTLLKQYNNSNQHTMLFISHDLAFVSQVADRIIVMRDGAIVDDFPRTQLFNANRHEYTQALLNMNEIEIKK
jgi:peptide/nickel transport system ATP-binding protein